MTRDEYIQAVFSHLKRLTWDEREAIRAELDGHMEDRFESLRELGYDETEAEERTLAAMGGPGGGGPGAGSAVSLPLAHRQVGSMAAGGLGIVADSAKFS